MHSVGERLREERDRLGLSQVDFAKKAGCSRRSQSNYELNERAPDTDYLTEIGKIGVDVAYVVTGVRSKPVEGTVLRLPPLPPKSDEQGVPYDGIGKLRDRIKAIVDQIQDERRLRVVVANAEEAKYGAEMERRLEELELSKRANQAG